jgi:hypothetical protein
VQATDISITMLLRLCKHSPHAAAWMKHNRDSLKWIDSYLTSRKSGGFPHGSTLLKSRRGSTGATGGAYTGTVPGAANAASPVAIAMANLVTLKGVLTGGVHRGVTDSSSYDSDDEPACLVGE